jgi:hypothetical protein
MPTPPTPVPTELTHRDRAILRTVARGAAEFVAGAESVLYLDGLACSDQFAVCRLVRDGLITGARPGQVGQRVAARLTIAGVGGLVA